MNEHNHIPYRACILGASLHVGNRGCRALGVSLIQLILESKPEAEIRLLYGLRSPDTVELDVGGKAVKAAVVNYRLSPRARLREHFAWIFAMACVYRLVPIGALRRRIRRAVPWLGALADADFVGQIYGGDSFSDIYGPRQYAIGVMEAAAALFLGKDLVLLPQTYGPFNSRFARALARYVVRRAARSYARDEQSLEVARGLLGSTGDRATFCPDVAFVLESRMPDEVDIEPSLPREDNRPVAGVNVSGLLYNSENEFGLQCDYKTFVHALVARLVGECGARVLLVPHVISQGRENDVDAVAGVLGSLDVRHAGLVHAVAREYDQNEIKGIIGLCDFFIGSRMHACIAAVSQGIPCVGVAYSRKFKGVFESIGIGEMVVDAREHGLDSLLSECARRFERKEEVARRLAETIPAIQSEVRECFRALLAEGARVS